MKKKMSQCLLKIIRRNLIIRKFFLIVCVFYYIGCVMCVNKSGGVNSIGNKTATHGTVIRSNQNYSGISNNVLNSKSVQTANHTTRSSVIQSIANKSYGFLHYCYNNSEKEFNSEYENTTLPHINFNYSTLLPDFFTKDIDDINENDTQSLKTVNDSLNLNASLTHSLKEVNQILYIGGLFDLSGSRSEGLGRSELMAAKLAIDHVNKEHVIPGFNLQLVYNDTGCDPGVAMDALYDLIYRRQRILMVIGSACSDVTKTIAEIVPYLNLIIVSFASTSPALSEREKYTTFFRLAPADSSQNIPRARFITHFHWNIVATLYEMEEDYSLAIDDLGKTLEQHNVTIAISQSFRRYEDIAASLQAINEHDVRIIIGSFSETAARHVLCQAYNLKLFGSRYVWIFMGDYVERWWELPDDTSCTPAELDQAAEGYFTIDSLNSLSDDDVSSVNISLRQFLYDYDTYHGPRPISPYATSTYDTVWTIAITLKQTQERGNENLYNDRPRLESFDYNNGSDIKNVILDHMQNLEIDGISGPISFEGPDRKGISVISQNQQGYIARIALYEPDKEKLNFFCRTCQSITWRGGRAPRDKKVIVPRPKKILPLAVLCVSSVSVGGLVLAGIFLAYNLYHRRLRYIKLSSPKLNNVAVVGCMLVYSGIIVLGYDVSTLEDNMYPYICTARVFLFAAGFSLAFGAMFTKTYRVHQIFTRANSGIIRSKFLRDTQLLFIIGVLLIVDSAVLLLWFFIDPMNKHVTNLTEEASENDQDLVLISQLTTCHSEHLDKWTGAMYAYKGLMLVFGVYMAWETRSVKIPALNDSQYIGMNVYNVVIMSIIVVTISNILSHQPTLAYVMESSFMLFSTTMTLCLLFVPKIYAILTSSGDSVIAASGITVEANCRRFAVDEKRDLLYRAEVQNRVYKQEIDQLATQLERLERLLDLPIQPYPRLTQELLYLLPESRVDPTPTHKRRKIKSKFDSISDAGEMCFNASEDKSDTDKDIKASNSSLSAITQSHNNIFHYSSPCHFQRRANRLSIRMATSFAVSKLSKLKPWSRSNLGNLNLGHDSEDLKLSPSTPSTSDQAPPMETLLHCRLSHPLLRQGAVEERRNPCLTILGSLDKSENVTFESVLSDCENENDCDNAQITDPVSFNLQEDKDYLQVPASYYAFGCDTAQVHCPVQLDQDNQIYDEIVEYSIPNEQSRSTQLDTSELSNQLPRVLKVKSLLENDRQSRLRQLQSALLNIQNEHTHLDELECEVSLV